MDSLASPLEIKQRADDLYAKQDYLAAADEYRRLNDLQPGSSAMKQLGLSLTLGKKVDEGIEILKTAAAMQPADPEIRYAHGYALGTAGRFDEAIQELDAALNLQPNHIPARQGLIFCLLTSGQAIAQVNPHLGEQRLDRAQKLDPRNAHVSAAFLDFMVKNNQKGKITNFLKDLDANVKAQSPLKEMIEKLENDPDFNILMKQVNMAQQTAGPAVAAPSPVSNLKQVPCPACKQMIMDYAAICPHCNTRLRATGTFAGRDTGPKYEWQEIALTILSIVWMGLSALEAVGIFLIMQKFQSFGSYLAIFLVIAIARCCVALGLIFRVEWVGFIAKILCYLSLLGSSIGLMINFGTGQVLAGFMSLAQLILAGFMVYLINYCIGD